MGSQCRLFVTGIPAECNVADVAGYFEHFGRLTEVSTQITVNKTRAFVLKPADQGSYEAILYPNRPHFFAGRFLQCAPYESGESLLRHNIRNNKKRVIVKRVPSLINGEELRRWLEEVAGPVQSMFAYSTDDTSKRLTQDQRKYRTYSVIFSKSESVSRITTLQRIQFFPNMDYTTFEKFRPPREIKVGRELSSSNQPTKDSLVQTKLQKHLYANFKTSSKPNTMEEEFEAARSEDNQCKSLVKLTSKTSLDVNSLLHGIKPCYKGYFSNSIRKLPHYLENEGNLKFKVVKKRL